MAQQHHHGARLVSPTARISPSEGSMDERIEVDKLRVRQLMDDDLDELNRLQNCPESTKSSSRIPPIPKEKTKQWYESLNVDRGKFCLACFEGKKAFRLSPLSNVAAAIHLHMD